MGKIVRFLFILVFVVTCSFSIRSEAKESIPDYNFILKDLNDENVNLADFIDKKEVILFFWTSWCSFCRRELKQLQEYYPQLKKDNIELLAINVEESKKTVRRFMSKYNVEFRVLLDRDGLLTDYYGLVGIPTYIWIDMQGKIKYEGHNFPLSEKN